MRIRVLRHHRVCCLVGATSNHYISLLAQDTTIVDGRCSLKLVLAKVGDPALDCPSQTVDALIFMQVVHRPVKHV